MISFYKKYWRTAFDIGLLALTVYLTMLVFSYIYKIAAPILLAFVIYAIIEPFARFLHKHKFKKSIASAVSMLLFIILILGAITAAGTIFVRQISDLTEKVPHYIETLDSEITRQADYLQRKINALPPDITEKAKDYGGTIAGNAANLAKDALKGLVSALTSFSTFIINFTIAIVLAYFLSVEIENWKKRARAKTPRTFKLAFHFLRENVLLGLGGYVKAQLKLISITFALVFAGLLLLRVNNAFAISLFAAFFDILPLLGVSTLFIPWIIYLFITGDLQLAIWLCVLLAVVLGTRQILEPKITGDTLGVSAFTMLSFMVISLSIFGVAGLILSPVLIILLKALYEQGYLQRWIRLPQEEYDEKESL
ncbi:MAG TPA: sporulation integral membrane protein YtvI [Bacilli bacterium]